jgi:hypothetical protein
MINEVYRFMTYIAIVLIIPLLVMASYLYGKKMGKQEWECMHTSGDGACETTPNWDCNNSHYFTKDSMGLYVAGLPIVTNYTACADGFNQSYMSKS